MSRKQFFLTLLSPFLAAFTIRKRVVSYKVSSYIALSNLLKETSIDSVVENAARMLGKRAALNVDILTRRSIEENVAICSV